jgi:hypothetical protein
MPYDKIADAIVTSGHISLFIATWEFGSDPLVAPQKRAMRVAIKN